MTPANSYPSSAVLGQPEPAALERQAKIKSKAGPKGFMHFVYELLSEQKVEMRRGNTGISRQWKLVGVYATHPEAKAVKDAIEAQ